MHKKFFLYFIPVWLTCCILQLKVAVVDTLEKNKMLSSRTNKIKVILICFYGSLSGEKKCI